MVLRGKWWKCYKLIAPRAWIVPATGFPAAGDLAGIEEPSRMAAPRVEERRRANPKPDVRGLPWRLLDVLARVERELAGVPVLVLVDSVSVRTVERRCPMSREFPAPRLSVPDAIGPWCGVDRFPF